VRGEYRAYRQIAGIGLFLLLGHLSANAQLNVVPASTSCTCDGSFTFIASLAPPFLAELVDQSGTIVNSVNSPGLQVTMTGLCPSAFVLQLSGNGAAQTQVINIAVFGSNLGNAGTSIICSNAPPIVLSGFVSGIQPGGLWSAPDGLPNSGNYNPAINSPGLYLYSILNGGCTVSTGVWIEEIANSNAGLSTTYLICENYAPFFMTNVLAGNPSPAGTWYFTGGAALDGWFNPATMNTGLFSYVVPGVQGCEDVISTLFVLENLVPDPGENTSILACTGAGPFSMYDQLLGTPLAGGIWFNANNVQVLDVFDPSSQPAGVYRYHVNGQTPCTDQDSFLTIGFTSINPSGGSGSLLACQNGPPINMLNYLSGSPVPGGIWTNPLGQNVGTMIIPSNGITGNYIYYYPNVGCSPANALLAVTIELLPQAGPDQSFTFCENSGPLNLNSFLVNTSGSPGVWTQAGQPAGPVYTPAGPGSANFQYTITGTVCPADQSALQLLVDEMPTALDSFSESLCGSAQPLELSSLYPILPGLFFTDANGNAITSFDPLNSAPLPITATLPSGNSCPHSSAVIQFIVESPAFVNTSMYLPACSSDLEADLTSNGFNADYAAGIWTFNGVPIDPLISLDFSGIREYVFSSDPGSFCGSSLLTVLLEVFIPITAGSDVALEVCSNSDPVFIPDYAPSTPGAWYSQGQPVTDFSFDPSSGVSGLYQYIVPALGSCPADEAILTVSINPGIVLFAGDDLSACHGSPAALVGPVAENGYIYSWTGGSVSDDSITPTLVEFSNTGSQPVSFSLLLTADNGVCAFEDEVSVTVFPLPELLLAGNNPTCEGEILNLLVSGAANVLWEPAGYFEDATTHAQGFTSEENFVFSVTGTNAFGCNGSLQSEVIVHPLPIPIVMAVFQSACQPAIFSVEVDTSSEHIAGITWTLNGQFAGSLNSGIWNIDVPGVYDLGLVALSEFGCVTEQEWSNLFEVLQQPLASFIFTPSNPTILNAEVQFANQSVNSTQYFWDFAGLGDSEEESPSFTFPQQEPGTYEVCLRVESSDGCADSTCSYIPVLNANLFFAPNAFTPDQDGLNEAFRPIYLGYVDNSYMLQVYDRWGILIFESRDPQQAWTGNTLGGNHYAPNDVYHWQVELKDRELADIVRFKGHVTLIR